MPETGGQAACTAVARLNVNISEMGKTEDGISGTRTGRGTAREGMHTSQDRPSCQGTTHFEDVPSSKHLSHEDCLQERVAGQRGQGAEEVAATRIRPWAQACTFSVKS